jgi:hypothetical protein
VKEKNILMNLAALQDRLYPAPYAGNPPFGPRATILLTGEGTVPQLSGIFKKTEKDGK